MSVFPDNGIISLSRLRQSAKQRLRRIKSGEEPASLLRLHQMNPRAELNLAAVQWLIATEMGFDSWPALKAHTDAIRFAAQHPGFDAGDEPCSLHLRCGHDIAHALRIAGFRGQFHPLTDPYCMGPVTLSSPEQFRRERLAFIRDTFGVPDDELNRQADADDAILHSLPQRSGTVLWCEADPYDQLFLIAVLSSLRTPPPGMTLVSLSRLPGVRKFTGLGQLAPEILPWLWQQRRPVTQAAISTATEAWRCYRDPSPLALAAFVRTPHPELPHLNGALSRMLRELPDQHTGLSLTEQLALQILSEQGPMTLPALFRILLSEKEPLPFLGDRMFFAQMQPLITGSTPLLKAGTQALPVISLTETGSQVLRGEKNRLNCTTDVRRVGGVCITPQQPYWCTGENLTPVLTSATLRRT